MRGRVWLVLVCMFLIMSVSACALKKPQVSPEEEALRKQIAEVSKQIEDLKKEESDDVDDEEEVGESEDEDLAERILDLEKELDKKNDELTDLKLELKEKDDEMKSLKSGVGADFVFEDELDGLFDLPSSILTVYFKFGGPKNEFERIVVYSSGTAEKVSFSKFDEFEYVASNLTNITFSDFSDEVQEFYDDGFNATSCSDCDENLALERVVVVKSGSKVDVVFQDDDDLPDELVDVYLFVKTII